MRLIIASELANKSQSQLSALYRLVYEELMATEPDSIERANARASLDNISRAIAALRLKAPHP